MIANDPDLRVVGETGAGAEAVRMTWQLRPDVVLMYLGLSTVDGISTIRMIRSEARDTRFVSGYVPNSGTLKLGAASADQIPSGGNITVAAGAIFDIGSPSTTSNSARPVGTITLSQYIKAGRSQLEKINKEQKVDSQTQKNIKIDRVTIYEEKATKLGGLPANTWRLHLKCSSFPDDWVCSMIRRLRRGVVRTGTDRWAPASDAEVPRAPDQVEL